MPTAPSPALPDPPAEPPALPPLLQQVMMAFERETGMRMSFDDLSGFLTGMHQDIPAMRFDWEHQIHACSFCLFAHQDPTSHTDCIRNKIAVNRLVIHRRRGLHGLCHLGLLDIAEPLIYEGYVVGVFYYGSVVVRGQEAEAARRIGVYCARRGFDPAPYLEELNRVTVVEPENIPRYRETVRSVVRLAHFFCEAGGVRPELYRQRALRSPYADPEEYPYVVKETMHYVAGHLHEPFIVKDLAGRLKCHPDFLSRKFKQHIGIDLSFYLQQVRIDRAKKLLENPKVSIDAAAEQTGFSDRFHFSKVFRRITGLPPGEFKKQLASRPDVPANRPPATAAAGTAAGR